MVGLQAATEVQLKQNYNIVSFQAATVFKFKDSQTWGDGSLTHIGPERLPPPPPPAIPD